MFSWLSNYFVGENATTELSSIATEPTTESTTTETTLMTTETVSITTSTTEPVSTTTNSTTINSAAIVPIKSVDDVNIMIQPLSQLSLAGSGSNIFTPVKMSANEYNIFKALTTISSTSSSKIQRKIIMVLDQSGSMEPNRAETINAVNQFINTQKAVITDTESSCSFTLILFNTKCIVAVDNVPLNDVKLLTDQDYKPIGYTALYDAIGTAIEKFSDDIGAILVIVTDGEENASQQYSRSMIASLIGKYKHRNGPAWNVIYLASDPMLMHQANELNIDYDESGTCTSEAINFGQMTSFVRNNLTKTVASYRSK